MTRVKTKRKARHLSPSVVHTRGFSFRFSLSLTANIYNLFGKHYYFRKSSAKVAYTRNKSKNGLMRPA